MPNVGYVPMATVAECSHISQVELHLCCERSPSRGERSETLSRDGNINFRQA